MSQRYYTTPDGWEFSYTVEGRASCPHESGPPEAFAAAAAEAGFDAALLWGGKDAHNVYDDGDRPGYCRRCGHKGTRKVYWAWVYRPVENPDPSPLRSNRERVASFESPLRREAKAWAFEQYQVHAAELSAVSS